MSGYSRELRGSQEALCTRTTDVACFFLFLKGNVLIHPSAGSPAEKSEVAKSGAFTSLCFSLARSQTHILAQHTQHTRHKLVYHKPTQPELHTG